MNRYTAQHYHQNIIMQQITIFPLKPAMHLVYEASYELLPFL